jgi:hypothetical protein
MRKFLLLTFTLLTTIVFGQTTSISPYSGFGVGDISPKGYDRSFAMGGVGLAFTDSLSINPMNPASYSFFIRRNPMFQVGLKIQNMKLRSEVNSNNVNNFSFNNFAIGFPIAERGGIVLGINPVTTVGYNIIVAEEYTDADNNKFPIFNKFEGSGGYNKFYIGAAYRVIEKSDSLMGLKSRLSIGFNFSYIGGNKFSKVNVLFGDNDRSFKNTKFTSIETIKDFSFDFGAQYVTYLKKTSKYKYLSMAVGATANIPGYMNTSYKTLVNTFSFDATGVETNIDSVFFSNDLKGKTYIPFNYGIGVMLDINKIWQIGIDYEAQNWSNYNQVIEGIEIENNRLTNMFRVGIGLQFNPMPLDRRKVNTSYLKIITYRMGYRYNQDYLKFGDYQLTEQAISFGLNLPFSKSQSLSSFNFGIDIGTGGTTEHSLIREDFINVMFGLVLMPHRFNRWFVKRKYK